MICTFHSLSHSYAFFFTWEDVNKVLYVFLFQSQSASDNELRYCLTMEHHLASFNISGHNIVLLDNPGCDEYGSPNVTQAVETTKVCSSAYIFVLSAGSYRTQESSITLAKLLEKNPSKF